jgi:hypothetical protein
MFWRYPEQREITEDVVRHNPRRTGEGIIEYAERIAVLAGADAGRGGGLRLEQAAGTCRRSGAGGVHEGRQVDEGQDAAEDARHRSALEPGQV